MDRIVAIMGVFVMAFIGFFAVSEARGQADTANHADITAVIDATVNSGFMVAVFAGVFLLAVGLFFTVLRGVI